MNIEALVSAIEKLGVMVAVLNVAVLFVGFYVASALHSIGDKIEEGMKE